MFTIKVMCGTRGNIYESESVDVTTAKNDPAHSMFKDGKRRAFVKLSDGKTVMVPEGHSLYITDSNNNTVYSLK